ncbi:MAG: efflux RND transporter permease subunit [Eubacterium sp.]|nr:efflux RND transporter permease subunit [Eubacterium sp.]
MAIKFGKWVAKHRILIILLAVLLLIPAAIGYVSTRINYDVLSYLPKSLETVSGQDIMVDEFGMGAFSMVIVEGMENKDVAELETKLEQVEHVEKVIWYDDVADITLPVEIIPTNLRENLFNGDSTMMIALFDDTTSADSTMDAVTDMRKIVGEQAFISGMSGVVTDIKDLALAEMPVYIVVAATLSLLVLLLTMDSLVTPFIFLGGIGIAIIFNLGSNIFLGEISYITQALTAILQLGVTMDYSIFLLESYEANKQRFEGDKNRAMAHAISNTFKSVTSSSITTIAGFAALCFMTFKLGMDLGLVMAKGVIIGVIVCLTFLPAMILCMDKAIEKTSHKNLIPSLDGVSKHIVKLWPVALILFAVLLGPAIYGNSNYEIYYNIDSGLPQDLESAVANEKMNQTFNMNNMHVLLIKNGLSSKDKSNMHTEIKEVDGVKWVLGMDTFVGANFPTDMIPDSYKEMLQSDNYELQFVCSDYKSATDEVNNQIAAINDIVKKYSKESMVIGEAPLMKDLQDVTDIDLASVNYISIIAIFLIILLTFKSISIPVILVAVIEFAIFLNMSVPYYTGESLPFVASIVIGTIQLGATVDYAILMTSRYHKERVMNHMSKKEAISIAHRTSFKSIIISGLCLFAATFGVTVSSNIDMIKAICTLLSRGAIISTVVVILILPAMLTVFDKVICKTTWDMRKINY